jgi:DNA polymerase V
MKEMDKVKKDGRGGRRAGAGRPPGDSRLYTFRAPGNMAEVIDRQENKTGFIRSCIRAAMCSEAVGRSCEHSRLAANAGYEAEHAETICSEAVDKTRKRSGVSANGRVETAQTEVRGGLAANPACSPGRVIPATAVRGGMRLPFFDLGIRAGFPIPLDNDEKAQDIELLRMLCPHPEASYLIRVAGNSMIDAGINDGDIIIVDKSHRNPGPSEVAVCELNGEYTLKRFEKDGDGCGWLVPANPDYPRIRITEDDSFSVWGTVSYIIHKPRL